MAGYESPVWEYVKEEGSPFAIEKNSSRVFGIGTAKVWEVWDPDKRMAVLRDSVPISPENASEAFVGSTNELKWTLNAAL